MRVKVSHLQLDQHYGQQSKLCAEIQGCTTEVDQNWGDSGIQLIDYVYPDRLILLATFGLSTLDRRYSNSRVC